MNLINNDSLSIIKEIQKKSYIKRFLAFLCGVFLLAFSYNIFLAPNDLVPGGIGGLAIIINKVFNINNSITIFIFNIFLLIISYLLLGKEKTRATIFGAILFPLFINLTQNINEIIKIDNSQLLLSTIFGGVLFGFGAGIIFKAGFTTGGTDIINQLLSKYLKISIGKSMLISDGLIVLSSVFTFGITHLMYSIITLYIISLMSDRVILGISDSKAFYIITTKQKEISKFVIQEMGHSVTVFDAKGGFSKEKNPVLFTVIPTKEYYKFKEGIHLIDPNAFFTVIDAYEVRGGA